MKIISIDVGMKHLAYCILDYDKSKNEYAVLEWNVMDLCKSKITQKCKGIMKINNLVKKHLLFIRMIAIFVNPTPKRKNLLFPQKISIKLKY